MVFIVHHKVAPEVTFLSVRWGDMWVSSDQLVQCRSSTFRKASQIKCWQTYQPVILAIIIPSAGNRFQ